MYHFVMAIMIYNQAITLKPPDGLFHQREVGEVVLIKGSILL